MKKMSGKQMKKIREQNGLTQQQLAELLGYKYYASICEMESGRRAIPKLVESVVGQMKK